MTKQTEENQKIKEAHRKENEFLKNEVMDEGAVSGEDDKLQNRQTQMEKGVANESRSTN